MDLNFCKVLIPKHFSFSNDIANSLCNSLKTEIASFDKSLILHEEDATMKQKGLEILCILGIQYMAAVCSMLFYDLKLRLDDWYILFLLHCNSFTAALVFISALLKANLTCFEIF